jgi:predicted metal-dependent phosphotriesterase family hydrolase
MQMFDRRAVIASLGVLAGTFALRSNAKSAISNQKARKGEIQTVLGAVDPNHVGSVLFHEHLFIDYAQFHLDDPALVTSSAHEFMDFDAKLGASHQENLIVDVSSIGIRVPDHAQKLRDLSMVLNRMGKPSHIVMGTGFYTASTNPTYLAFSEKALAQVILDEFNVGIGSTGIRPGIISEVGLSDMGEFDKKILKASARVQHKTGLAINLHFGVDGGYESPWTPERWQGRINCLNFLREQRANLKRIVFGHSTTDPTETSKLAHLLASGANIAFDGLGTTSDTTCSSGSLVAPSEKFQRTADLIASIVKGDRSLAERIILSHDVYTPTMLNPGCGFMLIGSHFVRILQGAFQKAGISNGDNVIAMITSTNAQRLLTLA